MNNFIMEKFTPMMVDALTKFIKTNTEITDNNLRADYIVDLLKKYGFKEVGCGTNRIVVEHNSLDDVVFKIALDSQGIIDNNLEYDLSKKLQPFVSKTYENIGMIAASEKVETFTKIAFMNYWIQIREILFTIAQKYILNDVGPKEFLNWGIRKNGDIVILDYAYLTKITPQMNFTCKAKMLGDPVKCGGQLRYTNDFSEFECIKCGAKFSIGDIANTTDGESLGFNCEGVDNCDDEELSDFKDVDINSVKVETQYDYDSDGFNKTF